MVRDRWIGRLGSFLLLGCVLTTGCATSNPAPKAERERPPLEITYVANMGVLFAAGEHKVLIDALFDRPNPAYVAPPAEMRTAMLAGRAPFDAVDLALVTHGHADHFDAEFAVRWLHGNPEARLVAPIDAVAAMHDAGGEGEDGKGWERVRDRVIAIDLEVETVDERTVAGIGLTIYRTMHSGDREFPDNLMYRVDLGGRTVFHEGDSDGNLGTFSRLDPGQKPIEVALVRYWHPTDPDGARILEGYLKAPHVGLVHLPIAGNAEAPAVIERVSHAYEDLFLFMEPGQRKTIP